MREFFLGGVLTICLRRFAARSVIIMDMVLPSSSVRGLCFTTVARRVGVLVNRRLCGCEARLNGRFVLCGAGRDTEAVADLVRQAWKKVTGSWLRSGRAASKTREIDLEDIVLRVYDRRYR